MRMREAEYGEVSVVILVGIKIPDVLYHKY
jgi:hypothetical protein